MDRKKLVDLVEKDDELETEDVRSDGEKLAEKEYQAIEAKFRAMFKGDEE